MIFRDKEWSELELIVRDQRGNWAAECRLKHDVLNLNHLRIAKVRYVDDKSGPGKVVFGESEQPARQITIPVKSTDTRGLQIQIDLSPSGETYRLRAACFYQEKLAGPKILPGKKHKDGLLMTKRGLDAQLNRRQIAGKQQKDIQQRLNDVKYQLAQIDMLEEFAASLRKTEQRLFVKLCYFYENVSIPVTAEDVEKP